jgi:hypothetical protein
MEIKQHVRVQFPLQLLCVTALHCRHDSRLPLRLTRFVEMLHKILHAHPVMKHQADGKRGSASRRSHISG